eukprot:365378-Chlamydomonas_euryale.AAC.6
MHLPGTRPGNMLIGSHLCAVLRVVGRGCGVGARAAIERMPRAVMTRVRQVTRRDLHQRARISHWLKREAGWEARVGGTRCPRKAGAVHAVKAAAIWLWELGGRAPEPFPATGASLSLARPSARAGPARLVAPPRHDNDAARHDRSLRVRHSHAARAAAAGLPGRCKRWLPASTRAQLELALTWPTVPPTSCTSSPVSGSAAASALPPSRCTPPNVACRELPPAAACPGTQRTISTPASWSRALEAAAADVEPAAARLLRREDGRAGSQPSSSLRVRSITMRDESAMAGAEDRARQEHVCWRLRGTARGAAARHVLGAGAIPQHIAVGSHSMPHTEAVWGN